MGINAIMMAEMCESVTFLDITPQILELLERISIVPDCRIAFRLLEESYQQAWEAGYALTSQQTITFALSIYP